MKKRGRPSKYLNATHKKCPNCYQTKPLSEFYPKRYKRSPSLVAYQNECKVCRREICVAYARFARLKRSRQNPDKWAGLL